MRASKKTIGFFGCPWIVGALLLAACGGGGSDKPTVSVGVLPTMTAVTKNMRVRAYPLSIPPQMVDCQLLLENDWNHNALAGRFTYDSGRISVCTTKSGGRDESRAAEFRVLTLPETPAEEGQAFLVEFFDNDDAVLGKGCATTIQPGSGSGDVRVYVAPTALYSERYANRASCAAVQDACNGAC